MNATDTPAKPADWRSDGVAGLSEAALSIPEVMGYARIAGMPPVSGLYTLLLPLLAFAAFGSSRSLVVAADSATASILSGGLSAQAGPESAPYMALVTLTTFLTAIFLLIARLFRLGFLADFLSRTVLAGFLTGVGAQVGIMMLHDMTGLPQSFRNALLQLGQDVRRAAIHPGALHVPMLALSAGAVVILLLGQKFLPRAPMALGVVAASIVVGRFIGLPRFGITTLGPLESGFPTLVLPRLNVDTLLTVTPIAASCMFVIIAQSAATARAFATRGGNDNDTNADILGLSAANMTAALSGTDVVNGSPTKTSFAVRCGARSQRSQVIVAILTGAALFWAMTPLQYLPRCVLSAIVFVVGLNMIDLPTLRAIRRESPGEFRLALLTAATVVAVGVEEGILMAIVVSLLRHVRHSYEPRTSVLLFSTAGFFEAVACRAGAETEPGLIIYRFGADLFYAHATRFADDIRLLLATAPHPASHIVVDASAVTDIDYSASAMLRDLLPDLKRKNITLSFGRVSSSLRADMIRHHLAEEIGADNLFDELHIAVAQARNEIADGTRSKTA
jgi:MFS superfamily sulfate permease-like transporter